MRSIIVFTSEAIITGNNFIDRKHKNLPEHQTVTIGVTGTPVISCLTKEFAKQNFLHNSFMKLVPNLSVFIILAIFLKNCYIHFLLILRPFFLEAQHTNKLNKSHSNKTLGLIEVRKFVSFMRSNLWNQKIRARLCK